MRARSVIHHSQETFADTQTTSSWCILHKKEAFTIASTATSRAQLLHQVEKLKGVAVDNQSLAAVIEKPGRKVEKVDVVVNGVNNVTAMATNKGETALCK